MSSSNALQSKFFLNWDLENKFLFPFLVPLIHCRNGRTSFNFEGYIKLHSLLSDEDSNPIPKKRLFQWLAQIENKLSNAVTAKTYYPSS